MILAFGRLRSVAAATATMPRAVLDFLLPPECLTCDAIVARPGQLCGACFRRTAFITEPCCRACGVPFAYAGQGGDEQLCPGCRDHPPRFERARGALRYDDQARRLVLPLKHADRVELAVPLAEMMLRAGAALVKSADFLVPVPMHRWRLFRRRYNQAALLARALSRLSRVPTLLDGLCRVRATPTLGDRSAAERTAVVAGAFAVRRRRRAQLAGARVVLIDDVMTSGATANACADALKEAGAVTVDVLVAARVPDPRLRR
jgi:ComF family protein